MLDDVVCQYARFTTENCGCQNAEPFIQCINFERNLNLDVKYDGSALHTVCRNNKFLVRRQYCNKHHCLDFLESLCQCAEYTDIQWNFTNYPESKGKCRIVKCRHPDAVKAARLFNETDGDSKELGIFQSLDGVQYAHNATGITGEECLYRRSRFCNSSCPGYKAFVESSEVETKQDFLQDDDV